MRQRGGNAGLVHSYTYVLHYNPRTLMQGAIKSYSPSDMCASPARDYKYAPLILHDVVLSGLVRARHCVHVLKSILCQCQRHRSCCFDAKQNA